jgi:putative flippase GtrA
MKASTKRVILRCVHLVAVIPVLGYIYQPVAEAEQYQRFTQLVFIPVAILAGYWMYMGLVWAVLGAVAWVGLNYFLPSNTGFAAALLAQIVLFIVRYILRKTSKRPTPATA